MSYSFKKYVTDPENLKKKLDKYGVAIIPNVLDDQECKKMVSGMWDFFETITENWDNPIKRNKEKSWKEFYELYPKHSMLFQNWGVGQAQVSWDLRQNPKIVNIFSKLWQVKPEDLLVSFDGFSFNPPPEKTNRGWYRKNRWYHSDQSFTRNDFECIQSWATGLDVEKGDASLAFYEKSHKYHKDLAKKFNITEKADWYIINEKQEKFLQEKGCTERRIKCPKGSLVFWDSRTIHAGIEASRERKNPKFRAVIYLCYQPKSLSTKANIKKRIKALNDIRTTNHWPSKGKLFPVNPRSYGKEIPTVKLIKKPKLTKLGESLVGL